MLDRVIIGEPEIPTATDRPNTYNITIVDLKTTQLDLMTFIDNNLVGLSYVRQLAFYGMSILEGGWKGLLESNQINHGNKPKLQLVYYIVTISLNRGVDVEVFSIPLNLIQAETEIIKRLLDDIA
jgi:hypothetical protein